MIARAGARHVGARLLMTAVLVTGGVRLPAHAGHDAGFHPSYYPQEIIVETVPPDAASPRIRRQEIHAYVGADPFAGKALPAPLHPRESLRGWIVVTLNREAPALATSGARCAAADRIMTELAHRTAEWVFHPYPVTPWHADFLHHADLAEAGRAAVARPGASALGSPRERRPRRGDAWVPRLHGHGLVGERLAGAVSSPDAAWDAVVEEISVDRLLAAHATSINGWQGPPWLNEGWFHAWALLADAQVDHGTRQRTAAAFDRLTSGDVARPERRVEAERELVAALRSGCERLVAGFTVRREPLNGGETAGVENAAGDPIAGLTHPIFPRTAKLKGFPLNGRLIVGVPDGPSAAWNPVAGFTDVPGRLVWAMLGDPGLFPDPGSGGWVGNRVALYSASRPGPALPVPRDALVPDPRSGRLMQVGAGKTARQKLVYRVLTSAFHDGSRMTVADVLYPFAFAAVWSTNDGDPAVARTTALARDALAGVRLLQTETAAVRSGGTTTDYPVPIVEVYLTRGDLTPDALATIAAPWSTVPWHLLALMEEAVQRGGAAFSREEAARRKVPWLDLARDEGIQERLSDLVRTLEIEGRVPAALNMLVDAREARRRWAALARFGAERGHFLVTNGPYELHAWTPSRAILRAFRDPSYPLGAGSYDRYADVRSAVITRAEVLGDRVEVRVEARRGDVLACRYVVLTSNGGVVRTGTVVSSAAASCAIPVDGLSRPLIALVAPTLGGRRGGGPVKVLRLE